MMQTLFFYLNCKSQMLPAVGRPGLVKDFLVLFIASFIKVGHLLEYLKVEIAKLSKSLNYQLSFLGYLLFFQMAPKKWSMV